MALSSDQNIETNEDLGFDTPIDFDTPSAKPIPPVRLAAESGKVVEQQPDELLTNFSHRDLARIWIERYGEQWRYVKDWNSWLWFNGERWEIDSRARIDHEIVEFMGTVARTWPTVRTLSPNAQRELEGRPFAGHVRDMVKVNLSISATAYQWDQDDYLLGVPNGTLDLRSGVVRPSIPGDFITKQCRVSPVKGPSPEWDKFMAFFNSNSKDKLGYIKRLCGLCLSGVRLEQNWTFLHGSGGNGKGVFLQTLKEILGSYSATCRESTFMQNRGPTNDEELAQLQNVRLAIIDETRKGSVLDEQRIQSVTGGGSIRARALYENSVEFPVKFRLIMAGNYKPILRATGQAMKRRMHLFPALGKVEEKDQDMMLQEKLRAEYPAIMAWMIEGFKEWEASRLTPPEEMREATAAYMESEDTVGDWIEDRCKISPANKLNRVLAYRDYKDWCVGQGKEHSMPDRLFYEDLETKGFQGGRSSAMRFIVGLELQPKESDQRSSWHDE